jgi:hypothetical protein
MAQTGPQTWQIRLEILSSPPKKAPKKERRSIGMQGRHSLVFRGESADDTPLNVMSTRNQGCSARFVSFFRSFCPPLAPAVGKPAQQQQHDSRDAAPSLVRASDVASCPLVALPFFSTNTFPYSFFLSGRLAHLVCCLECSIILPYFLFIFSLV